MSTVEWVVVVAAAVAGWWAVSWVFDRNKRLAAPEQPPDRSESASRSPDLGPPVVSSLAFTELAERWSSILGVSQDSSVTEIEQAYHAALAECDRLRFAASSTPEQVQRATQRRAEVDAAYEFARIARSGP